jgi:hypothetical protein
MTTSTIGLADAIENLRQELTEATKRGEGQSLRFNVNGIDLELAVEIAREGGAGGKVSFKVLSVGGEIGGEGKLSHSNVHRIKVTLKPAGGSYQVDDTVSKRPD